MSVGVRDLSRLSTLCYRLRIVLYRPILSSLGPNLGPPMEMPHWVRELRRRWRYFAPIVIWYAAIAFFIAAVWIYVALKADS